MLRAKPRSALGASDIGLGGRELPKGSAAGYACGKPGVAAYGAPAAGRGGDANVCIPGRRSGA